MAGGSRFFSRHPAQRADYRPAPHPGAAELVRVGRLLSRAEYPGWQFCPVDAGRSFIAFRSDPADPWRLQRLGPWPLPEDAGPDEVEAAALAAVVAVDGDGARASFRSRPEGEK